MKAALVGLAFLGLTTLGSAQRDDFGQPFSISGVPAALEAPVSAVELEGRTLRLEAGSVRLVVAPLPGGLEDYPFAGSSLRAERRNHPDGPETRLEFRSPDGQALALGSDTALRSLAVAGWRFESNIGRSFARVRLEKRGALLQIGRTVTLRGEGATWCVILRALHVPQTAKPGVALEAEGPRFDWTATRASSSGRCASP